MTIDSPEINARQMLQQFLDLRDGKRVRDEDLLFDWRILGPSVLARPPKIGRGRVAEVVPVAAPADVPLNRAAEAPGDPAHIIQTERLAKNMEDNVVRAASEQHEITAKSIRDAADGAPGSWTDLKRYHEAQPKFDRLLERISRESAERGPFIVLNPSGRLDPDAPNVIKYASKTSEGLAKLIQMSNDAYKLDAFAENMKSFIRETLNAPYSLTEDKAFTFINLEELLKLPPDQPVAGGVRVEKSGASTRRYPKPAEEKLTPREIIARGLGVHKQILPPAKLPDRRPTLLETELIRIREEREEQRKNREARDLWHQVDIHYPDATPSDLVDLAFPGTFSPPPDASQKIVPPDSDNSLLEKVVAEEPAPDYVPLKDRLPAASETTHLDELDEAIVAIMDGPLDIGGSSDKLLDDALSKLVRDAPTIELPKTPAAERAATRPPSPPKKEPRARAKKPTKALTKSRTPSPPNTSGKAATLPLGKKDSS